VQTLFSHFNQEPNSQLVKCARCRSDVGETLLAANKTIEAYKFYKSNVEMLSVRKHMAETIAR